MNTAAFRFPRTRVIGISLAFLAIGVVLSVRPAHAQEKVEDVFGTFGTTSVVKDAGDESAPPERKAGEGTIRGRVFDAQGASPVKGVTVIVKWPAPAGGGSAKQEVRVTDADGAFEIASIPPGSYDLTFVKSGYRQSTMTNLVVRADEIARADFPLQPIAAETTEDVLDLEEFVVEAAAVGDILAELELRMDADELLNVMSAEDLSKFAAGDVAEALNRVAGVNVVEGQFAIIRGLEDRYSSTLYNSAPVPSPDPDKQSVQLDLFPSDVVSNLLVAKTFSARHASNSASGSIDILTHDYPEKIVFSLSGGTGFNANARDRFLEFERGSPVGSYSRKKSDTIESDFGGSLAGRSTILGREVRFKLVQNQEIDYATSEGFQEDREPKLPQTIPWLLPPPIVQSGDLSLGELNLSGGRFDLTTSERSEQTLGYGAIGFDLDREGNHAIDASVFFTRRNEDTVQWKENGVIPGLDYAGLAALQGMGALDNTGPLFSSFADAATRGSWIARSMRQGADEGATRGALVVTSFAESKSFERERELWLTQANGDHRFDAVPGLHVTWAANRSRTRQQETALGARYFYEPDDEFQIPSELPASVDDLGPGRYAIQGRGIVFSANEIEERLRFGRLDVEYEAPLLESVLLRGNAGLWVEKAEREVGSGFLEAPVVNFATCSSCAGVISQFAIYGDTPQGLGRTIFDNLVPAGESFSGVRNTTNESNREIDAWYVDAKATLWERIDVLGGLRFEKILIESRNDPYVINPSTGQPFVVLGGPQMYPSRYLFFDRLDSPGEGFVLPGTIYNDEILGIDVPVDPATGFVTLSDVASIDALVNTEIDERKVLPSLGLALRPLEGLSLRGAYSQTVARPSFREMGYYVSVEPGTDDRTVGNPQLTLSEVESWDLRVEYTWGEMGDLVAASAFRKKIDDPIESIIVRDPTNLEDSGTALFRTFFNNPNQATVQGIEVEARKSLDFLGVELLKYLSVGGNYTLIDAEVGRGEAELARAAAFFGTASGDVARFSGLERKRRLFNQPEWIGNADISFDHPDWGTRITLALFAISDVLDAAGVASIGPDGTVRAFTLDRYVDAFLQLDLVASQKIRTRYGDWTIKLSVKNLTDSVRKILYDPYQTTHDIEERAVRVGRDYSFSIGYSLEF